MNQCVLVVLLEYGHFMQLPMPEKNANEIIHAWVNETIDGKVTSSNTRQAWAFDIKAVKGIHIQFPQEQQQAFQYKNPFGNSGIN